MNEVLLDSLRLDVDEGFPRAGGWCVLALSNAAAPVVSISRNQGSGNLTVPVFFIAIQDHTKAMPMASAIYQRIGHVAKLWHTKPGKRIPNYLVVPALYHMVDSSAFVGAMDISLAQYEQEGQSIAWFSETCEVLINQGGQEYRAIRGPNGAIQAQKQ